MLLTCYHASSTGTSLNMVQHKLRNFHIFSTSIRPYPGWQSIFRNSFCKTTKYCFCFVVVGSFEVYRKAGVPIMKNNILSCCFSIGKILSNWNELNNSESYNRARCNVNDFYLISLWFPSICHSDSRYRTRYSLLWIVVLHQANGIHAQQ